MPTDNKVQKKSPWTEIRKVLSRCSERDLLSLITELYALSPANQDFLKARFIQNEEVLSRYKALIKKHLAPDEPWKRNQPISIKEAKKVISDYKKASSDQHGLLDLMVCYVEYGTDFLCSFGDMYEQYYTSLESVFDNALKLMKKTECPETDLFLERLRIVVKKAERMGWGYYDSLCDMLVAAYPPEGRSLDKN